MTDIDTNVLNGLEKLVFALRSLYSRHGYSRYRMSKFEEYDLYSRNKDFLVSDSVITFTDTNGKLMALKPDVTLSIVKNNTDQPDCVRKLYYNENVYRVSKGTNSFSEIMQAGLECIGNIDACCIGEVLMLAAKSLALCSEKFVLDISHLGLLSALITGATDDISVMRGLYKCVGEKNVHGIADICRSEGIGDDARDRLIEVVGLYGSVDEVLEKLSGVAAAVGADTFADELKAALSVFDGSELKPSVRIDFSVVGDPNYYNGIVFKGFVDGVPGSVLSGGSYNGLMKKMGSRSKAIGFAVYLDMLERLYRVETDYDFDVLLRFGDDVPASAAERAAEKLINNGETVFTCSDKVDPALKFRRRATVDVNGEVKIVE